MARSMLNFNFANNADDSAKQEEALRPVQENEVVPPAGIPDTAEQLPAATVPVSQPDPFQAPASGNPYFNPVSGLDSMQTQSPVMNPGPVMDSYSSPAPMAGSKRRNGRRASSSGDEISPEEQEERRAQEIYASAFPSWDLMPPQVLIRRVVRKK